MVQGMNLLTKDTNRAADVIRKTSRHFKSDGFSKNYILTIIYVLHIIKIKAGDFMNSDTKRIAEIFKALGDENRVEILIMLSKGEKCACKLLEELEVSQPTLSHHMKILCDAKLVNARKEGRWMHYSLSQEGINEISNYLSDVFGKNQ